MIERGKKSNLTALAVMAVAVLIAACSKDEAHNGPVQPKAELDTGLVGATGGEENLSETPLPTIVERRHFAIYSTYRVLFDDSASVYQSPAPGQDDGLQPAVMTSDRGMPACSMRAMP